MMKKHTYFYIVGVIILFISSTSISQTCGFGCLGLSGVYAGYSFENYQADGLNNYLNSQLSDIGISDKKFHFEKGTGFRFGMNIVRAKYDTYFFTVKGYYQFLKEEQTVSEPLLISGDTDFKSKFEMNHWALGFDFGIPVVDFLDWKIVDGSIKFFDTKLTNQVVTDGGIIEEAVYEIPKVTVGFAVGSGLIVHIIKDYISIEGMGMYNFSKINNLTMNGNSTSIPDENSDTDLISKGGLSATIQLNIGIPIQ